MKLQCVKHVIELPIRRFSACGVHSSINSDEPAYFTGYIQDNYCAVEDAFGLGVEDWERITKAAINGSWCDDDRKNVMLSRLDEAVEAVSNLG